MELVKMKIADIVPYDKNPRKNDHAVADLVQSIKDCEYIAPIVVDEDNVVLAGHTRLKALKRLKYKEVDVVVKAGLTEEQKRKYRILDNKTAEGAEWDFDLLADECIGLDFDDYSFDFEFGEDEQTEIIEDEAPEVDEESEPTAKLGDIWQLGRHRLGCLDSTNPEHVARLMDGVKADMLLTDPPYNVNYEGKTKDALKIENDKMDNNSFRQFLRDAFFSADSVMKAGAVFYIWHADSEGYNFRGACFDIGWKVRQCILWVKNSIVMGRQDYHWKHEPCLYGWKDGAAHYWGADRKQRTTITSVDLFELKSKKKEDILKIIDEHELLQENSSIIYEDKPNKNAEHPTMKPIRLLARQLKNSSKSGAVVLDLFGGSGSTLIASEQLGRNCYMAELDPRYADVIIKRFENLTGETAVLVENINGD